MDIAQTVTTDLRSDRVKLQWELPDWKMSRQYHSTRNKQLISPEYCHAHCRWQLELLVNSPKPGSPSAAREQLKASIYLRDCSAKPSAVVVRGFIGVRPHGGAWYVRDDLFGVMVVSERRSCRTAEVVDPASHLEVVAELDIFIGEPTFRWEARTAAGDAEAEAAAEEAGQVARLSEALGRLLGDESTSDVTIVVGPATVPGHRALLAARSPVLRAKLEEMRCTMRSGPAELEVDTASLEAWRLFQRFLYTGQAPMDGETALGLGHELLELAAAYEVELMAGQVVAVLRAALDRDNVLDVLALCHRHSLGDLQAEATALFRSHLEYYKKEKRPDFVRFAERNKELTTALLEDLLG